MELNLFISTLKLLIKLSFSIKVFFKNLETLFSSTKFSSFILYFLIFIKILFGVKCLIK